MTHTQELLAIVLGALWGGVWWRFRGGALSALTGFDPGTSGMRAIAAVAIGSPMVAGGELFLLIIPLWWIAWSLAGWGAFQSMGHETTVEMKNPVAAFLERCGLGKTMIDIIGMAIEGILTLTLPGLLLGWLIHPWIGAVFILCGIGFAPLYLLADRGPYRPDWGRFARAGSEWGEVLVGAWVGVVLALAMIDAALKG